jgi:dual specificity tyrosine-phosphorylation-regulated kinase 2/3/4
MYIYIVNMDQMKKAKNLYLAAVKKLSSKIHSNVNIGKNEKIHVKNFENPHGNKVIRSPDAKKTIKFRNLSLEGKIGENDTFAEQSKKNSSLIDLSVKNTWNAGKKPCLPGYVLRYFSHNLTFFEQDEILSYKEIYYIAPQVKKFQPNEEDVNFGFDDDRNDYVLTKNDHIAYRYEILDILGRGSYGQVIKAFDHKEKIFIAIKIIRNITSILRQAKVEIQILTRLSQYEQECEYLINMIDNFIFRNHICITFQLLPMNLHQFQKSKKFRPLPSYFLKIFSEQILSGIKFSHNLGIIHCDLKPENIMLGKNLASFKVIDFGSSCFLNKRIYQYIQSRYYRAPEVVFNIKYDQKIDIWSFGCILVELVIGKPVFIGNDSIELLGSMIEVLGMPPAYLLEQTKKRSQVRKYLKKLNFSKNQGFIGRRPLKDLLGDDQKFVNFVTGKQ